MLSLTARSWSPYVAGVVIGLLQIPAFLLIETALGASSSYVTVGGLVMSWADPAILKIDYVARHVATASKNWWQVALVVGIAQAHAHLVVTRLLVLEAEDRLEGHVNAAGGDGVGHQTRAGVCRRARTRRSAARVLRRDRRRL